MLECQVLIDKIREPSYLKVRARQSSKPNSLLQKEGIITWSSNPNHPQLGSSEDLASAPSQPGRRAGSTGMQFQAGRVSPQAGSGSDQS